MPAERPYLPDAETLDRVRTIALALPEVSERLSHGVPCFYVRGRRALCYFHDNHHDGRVALWCPAPHGVQAELVSNDPARFFMPTPSASGVFSDWIGIFLDTSGDDVVDWTEISRIVTDAYRLVAPRLLVVQLPPTS
jgi:hypothetical protein